jgi:hypothetical protein
MNSLVSVDTGYAPHKFQLEIHRGLKRFSVLVCHRRFGKTFLAINTLIDAALRTPKQSARYGYVAPFLKQAKQVSWDYLKRFAYTVPGVKVNESELSIEFPNGSLIRLYGSDNGEAMRGVYFDGVVIDEVADCRLETWPEIIRPALADRRGWCLFIGTPKGLNQFYDLYQRALKDDEWYGGLYRADETGLIDEKELADARSSMSPNQYRQEFLCDFSASADNVLISIDDVSDATKHHYRHDEYTFAPKIMGVDVAYMGSDKTAIIRRQGLVTWPPIIMVKADPMQIVGRLLAEVDAYQPDGVFVDDTGGYGGGVIARLRELGHDAVGVNFGGKPDDPRYRNKRTEMWMRMRDWIKSGGAIPDIIDLKNDLVAPTYKVPSTGVVELEPKDKIKERLGRSPDIADALALTFAYFIGKKQRHVQAVTHADGSTTYEALTDRAAVDYNPFGS